MGLIPNKSPLCVAKFVLFLFSPLFAVISNSNEKEVICWDYAGAYSLNVAHAKQKSTLRCKVCAFFVFSAF
jgi:hypothetical protein